MAERATIFQTTRWAVETGAGTAPLSGFRQMQSLGLDIGIKDNIEYYRPMGTKFPTVTILGKEWTQAGLTGVPTYTELIYPLSSVLTTATLGTVVAGTAYTWTFTPASTAADSPKTFTIEQGESTNRIHRFSYGIISDFGMSFTRERGELTGTMMGQRLTDNVTFGTLAAAIALAPVAPSHIDVFLEDAQTALGTATALLRPLSVSWNISNRFGPIWPLNTSFTSWAVPVELEPTIEVKLRMEADAQGLGLLTTMRADATKFMRIKGTGGTITGGGTIYTMIADTALRVSGEPSEFSDTDGVFALEWTLTGVHDATWGNATQWVVTNGIASL